MPGTVNTINSDQLERVQDTPQKVDGLQTMTHMILVEKLNYSEVEARREVERLKERQKLLEFLNEYLREVNSNTHPTHGTLDTESFLALKEKGLALLEEAENKLAQIEELREKHGALDENDPLRATLQKELEWLEEAVKEIENTLKSCDLINSKNEKVETLKYSEKERERLVENIRNQNKNLTQSNSYQQQVIQKLNNVRHETLMIAKQIMETLHSTFRKICSYIGGR